jgi:hypothetical protein
MSPPSGYAPNLGVGQQSPLSDPLGQTPIQVERQLAMGTHFEMGRQKITLAVLKFPRFEIQDSLTDANVDAFESAFDALTHTRAPCSPAK